MIKNNRVGEGRFTSPLPKVLESINLKEKINKKKGVKGVKSVKESMRTGEFCKRLINEEEGICARRGEKYNKTISETPHVLVKQ